MKKRILSMLLCAAMLLSTCISFASAASTPEEALGEVGIISGGFPMKYLSVNGKVQTQEYTYFEYYNPVTGEVKEIPAYCVNPTEYGVPQTVPAGESIQYLAAEAVTDPKIVGLVANMYPHRSLGELKLDNRYQAFYAGKIALWCYLLSDWDINTVEVNPALTGTEKEIGEKIKAAALQIYNEGLRWTSVPQPNLTAVPDQDAAYPVTFDGQEYLQQVFTVTSDTWVDDYLVTISLANPDDLPAGTKIVDMDNNEITTFLTSPDGAKYSGQFKVLYPAQSVEGQTGSVQFNLSATVYQYVVYYALCQETDEYGPLQSYLCDTDPVTAQRVSAISNYSSDGEPVTPDPAPSDTPDTPDTPTTPETPEAELKILKLEEGTEIPLAGANFEIKGPSGDVIGVYTTNEDGEINLTVTELGSFVITELTPPQDHMLAQEVTQTVTVDEDGAVVTFHNAPYGAPRVEKRSDTGENLPGVTVQIKHIESGVVYTGVTEPSGAVQFSPILPGAYEVREVAGIEGWIADTETVQTVNVVTGAEPSVVSIVNQELPGLRIVKYDRQTMELMAGVTFEVFKDALSLGRFQTDQLGEILLTDLEPGTYLAYEVDTGSDGHKTDSTTGKGIYGVSFLLYDARQNPIGQYTSDQDGWVYIDDLPSEGKYFLRELENEGYVPDDQLKTVYVEAGATTLIEWENTPITGQMQISNTM